MEQDHKSYEINVRHEISDEILRSEWVKTKMAVYNSFKAIETDSTPQLFKPKCQYSIAS